MDDSRPTLQSRTHDRVRGAATRNDGGASSSVLIVHADWSKCPRKRWYASAVLQPGWQLPSRSARTRRRPRDLLLQITPPRRGRRHGLCWLRLPYRAARAYALKVGFADFRAALASFGHGRWRSFYDPAPTQGDIAFTRPFYPLRPGGTQRNHLITALGVSAFGDLLRRCDRVTGVTRPVPCSGSSGQPSRKSGDHRLERPTRAGSLASQRR